MYCTSCGRQLEIVDRFCSQCGQVARQSEPRTQGGSTRPRRLVRPMREKNIAGVCAGFARYLDVDVTLLRILWLCIAIFTGGLGFVAYLICWIVMPKDYTDWSALNSVQQRPVPPQPAQEKKEAQEKAEGAGIV